MAKRQSAKEQASQLASQYDMVLIRKELEIYGIEKDGLAILISKSKDYDTLWEDALSILQKKFKK